MEGSGTIYQQWYEYRPLIIRGCTYAFTVMSGLLVYCMCMGIRLAAGLPRIVSTRDWDECRTDEFDTASIYHGRVAAIVSLYFGSL